MNIRAVESRRPRDEGGELLDAILAADTPALVTDASGHITSWNHAAERFFERQTGQVLGRRCYDIVGARDVFGNRFCHENCAVMSMGRKGEAIHAFELSVAIPPRSEQPLHVSVFPIRGDSGPGSAQLVHVFEPIDRSGRLARALERLGGAPASASSSAFSGPTPLPHAAEGDEPPLTGREKEILRWVAVGLQNKEIAGKVGISLATVRNHIHNILEKLEVHSKLEAVSLAFRKGWVAEPQPGRPKGSPAASRG
jgi:DNA-binding CsgD family transcriptional regulator